MKCFESAAGRSLNSTGLGGNHASKCIGFNPICHCTTARKDSLDEADIQAISLVLALTSRLCCEPGSQVP